MHWKNSQMRLSESIYLVGGAQVGLSDAFDCHVYVVNAAEGLVMIDAGGGRDPDRILANIAAEGLDPMTLRGIGLTHVHFDHACGAAGIHERTGCRVAVSEISADTLTNGTEESSRLNLAKQLGIYPEKFEWQPCPVDDKLVDGERYQIAGVEFDVLAIRGHSDDATALVAEIDGRRCMFCGDILFWGGVLGLINFPQSELSGYRRDLPRLADLSIDALFPGHGLFALTGGQTHIDAAIAQISQSVAPPSIGQFFGMPPQG